MKTSEFKAITIVLAFVVLQVWSSYAEGAADTPQALGNNMIAAIQAKNQTTLMSLIHPDVVAYLKANDPEKLDKTIQNWLKTKVPPNHEFIVQPIKEVPDYDPATQTLTFGAIKMYFPTPPTAFMILVGDLEAKVKVDGKEETKKGRGPVTIDAIAQKDGKWYIVLPELKSDGKEQPEK